MTGMEQYIIVYSKYIITLFMLLYCVLAFVGPFLQDGGAISWIIYRAFSFF